MKLPPDWPSEDSVQRCHCGYERGGVPLDHACAECGQSWHAMLVERKQTVAKRLRRDAANGNASILGVGVLLLVLLSSLGTAALFQEARESDRALAGAFIKCWCLAPVLGLLIGYAVSRLCSYRHLDRDDWYGYICSVMTVGAFISCTCAPAMLVQ